MFNELMNAIMKNKKYNKPVVEILPVAASAAVLVGSNKGLGIGEDISGGEGG